ncbi:transcription-repair coupling factor [Prevotellamassilia timonensis]|uniref:transcription-repair coupling factor n=1 Tax=Prevotellamassilia timonensis TaxID=1852370 RepID=UPI001F3CF314|nr:transcription-repair coupling factor [Prevotellamassilia timonensis]MCF2635387.1 transcription-repair coupling factor [Prevotellamassilia timonensis]
MQISELLSLFTSHPGVSALRHLLSRKTPRRLQLCGLQGSAAPMIFAALAQQKKKQASPWFFILNDEEEAGYFYHDLRQLCGDENVLFFPSSYRRAAKYARRDAANDILRTEVLNRLTTQETTERPLMIVTFPAAITEKVAPKKTLTEQSFTIKEGDTFDLTKLSEKLLELGFRRCDYVYEPGEFAVRGSILDVFSFSSEHPYRIDFFGDDVESLRTFEVQTQLSAERRSEVSIVPDTADSGANTTVDFVEYVPDDSLLIVRDLIFVADTMNQIYKEGFSKQAEQSLEELPEAEAEELRKKLNRELMLSQGTSLLRRATDLRRVELVTNPEAEAEAVVCFHTSPQPLFHKNFELLREHFDKARAEGNRLFILADSAKQNERLQHILDELTGTENADHFTPVTRTLHAGFSDQDLHLCCFTDHQIFDRFHKYNLKSDHARDSKMALTLKELMQFEVGDYVVHIDHGIGRFAGLVRMPSAGGEMQEMIKLTYKNEDAVYVSIHSLHKVSKYKGKEGTPPRVSSLGTGAWEKMKERTKKKIKDIARDLILLYSQRRETEGFAFSADTFLQHELEAGFAYEDTPDQLRVTKEVKSDMESPRPMDRLVCGDVGFGKTEIAVRAALKATCDNKQVAVLVPTTVLALQHFKTFSSRLKDFPVRVDYLSRARTTAQTRDVLKDLAEGKVNILVGTHKLIGKNVKWHDLGLLIIDEEQKFGVSVKEKLRQLKVNIDTLTMSATPIPRTLQFSLMGARDFSVIQTPPPNRRPIQTEVHTFHHEIIADAVNFEMSRNGQVFIVSPRIASLANIASLVRRYVPDARVAVGHGQMPPEELEKIITGFVNYDYDVLISTTIVENGIDIPNANTILIDGAHRFGLSDLHQMRGRVGRGSRKAFCYLLAPPLSLLPDDARRRLQAIENYSDLGSGIHIAMQDLDIRGAGNLLGAEQSGFIADLGYETYQKILSEAVSELKNEEFADLYAEEIKQQKQLSGEFFVSECTIECDLHAYLPETYVPGASERMMLYRELDSLSNEEQITNFRKRLLDRFGALPKEAEELLRIVPLRNLARRAGADRLVLHNRQMTLYFVQNTDSPFYRSAAFTRIIEFAAASPLRCKLDESKGRRRMTITQVPNAEAALITMQRLVKGE